MAFVEEYQDRANGLKPVRYSTPELEPILKATHGIMVYQEQLMQISQVLGGYTAGQSDNLRKATGKKSQKVMDEEMPKLKKGIIDNGYDETLANEIIKMIEPFVGYGFNKSHSASYANLAYTTAYLKHYYPAEFFAAGLQVYGDKEEKLVSYIKNAQENGIKVLPPDVNESSEDFSVVDDKTIRFGLNQIKGMPDKGVHAIIANRPYETAYEIIEKNEKSEVNKTSVKVLSLSGALDAVGQTIGDRNDIKNRLYTISNRALSEEDLEVFTERHKLEQERALLGTYMSGHPLDAYPSDVDLDEMERTGDSFSVHAVLSTIKRIYTKKGDPMAFIGLSFTDRTIDGVFFPNLYEKKYAFRKGDPLVSLGELIMEGMIVKVRGVFEQNHRGEDSFIIQDIRIPVRANTDLTDAIKAIQDERGEIEVVAPPVVAPSFNMNNFN